jgi:Tfp pilus assembly PilM family ATPase
MSVLTSWLASPVPDVALEISAQRVSAAVMATRGRAFAIHRHASEDLPSGLVTPSLIAANVADASTLSAAVRRVFEALGVSPHRIALVIPDVAARVSLIRFDQVPPRREDLDQLVRWQVRKSTPFPIEDAVVTYTPGARGAAGADFLVAMARREAILEYERACTLAGAEAGVVDLSTLSVTNLLLAGEGVPGGDWLLVHLRPDYSSLVIVRGGHVALFRSRSDDAGASLPDLVHQTVMYYQDRLTGAGFERVLLAGGAGSPDALEHARRSLEARLETTVDVLDPTRAVPLTDRVRPSAEDRARLAPLVGALLRMRGKAVAA